MSPPRVPWLGSRTLLAFSIAAAGLWLVLAPSRPVDAQVVVGCIGVGDTTRILREGDSAALPDSCELIEIAASVEVVTFSTPSDCQAAPVVTWRHIEGASQYYIALGPTRTQITSHDGPIDGHDPDDPDTPPYLAGMPALQPPPGMHQWIFPPAGSLGRNDCALAEANARGQIEDIVVRALVSVTAGLAVTIEGLDAVDFGDEFDLTLTIANRSDDPATGVAPAGGSPVALPEGFEPLSPAPDLPTTLGPGESASATLTYRATGYFGDATATAEFTAEIGGEPATTEGQHRFLVRVPLDVTVATSPTEVAIGDEFDVLVTATNRADLEIPFVLPAGFLISPSIAVSDLGAATLRDGSPVPEVGVTLASGEAVTFVQRMHADDGGFVDMQAFVGAANPATLATVTASGFGFIAIGDPVLAVVDLSEAPAEPLVPGLPFFVTGAIRNDGDRDVTDIRLRGGATPEASGYYWFRQDRLPRIVTGQAGVGDLIETTNTIALDRPLAPGESVSFSLLLFTSFEPEGVGRTQLGLQATGLADVDGAGRIVISDRAELFAAFADVNPLPWEDVAGWAIPLLEQAEGAYATARAGNFGWVLGIDEGLGNALLGLGETELAIGRAFQDLLRPATEEQQQQIAADLHDWWFDKTPRERAEINLARIEQSGEWLREQFPDQLVEVVGGGAYAAARTTDLWLQDLDRAYQAGDSATVAAMLTEPAASIGAGFLFEAAAAELILGRAAAGATTGGVGAMTAKKLSPRVHATAGYSARDGLPNGLRLSLPEGERLYGIPAATLDEALRLADATDSVIVARGRSASTLRKIENGANGKPPEVKTKSLKEADRHLYFTDKPAPADPDGFLDWVPGVAPTRPDPDDFLGLPRAEYDEAVLRYHERLAEYERYRSEIEHWIQNDFIYLENGQEIVTRLGIDEDGMLILTHNGQRLAGDNDLFHVFHEGGGEISQELYDQLFPWLEKDFDLKHGITLNRDFGAADEAERAVLDAVARGHMQSPPGGGEPGGALLLITGDGLVTGRIRNYTVNPNALPNHKTTATYIGLPGQTP